MIIINPKYNTNSLWVGPGTPASNGGTAQQWSRRPLKAPGRWRRLEVIASMWRSSLHVLLTRVASSAEVRIQVTCLKLKPPSDHEGFFKHMFLFSYLVNRNVDFKVLKYNEQKNQLKSFSLVLHSHLSKCKSAKKLFGKDFSSKRRITREQKTNPTSGGRNHTTNTRGSFKKCC